MNPTPPEGAGVTPGKNRPGRAQKCSFGGAPTGYYVKDDANDVAAIGAEKMLTRTGVDADARTAVVAAAAASLIDRDIPV